MNDITFLPLKEGEEPLYSQLYNQLAGQIRRGSLSPGTRMPGKRSLAQRLGLSVNTVDTAYQMLVAEGYLESRPRSGFFVQQVEQLLEVPRQQAAPVPTPPPKPRFDCSTGSVDTDLFPFRTWGRIQRDLLYQSPQLLHHGPRQGDENLRQAVLEYLEAYRGVKCSLRQLVIGAGVEYLLGLVGGLLKGKTAAIENPGYSRPGIILENNGVSCRAVEIDGSGLRVDLLEKSGADLCYITPSHHFPTGVTMPVGRRSQLLRWAMARPGRYILEDDYDAEFRFQLRPLPSLQGMGGPGGPVIYLFTFSKTLAPSIRIAGMVLPLSLVEEYEKMYGAYSNTVSRFEQQTLAQFIQRGHFTRHLARMRSLYKARLGHLVSELENAFGPGRLVLRGQHTGLHLLVTLPGGPSEEELVARAGAAGIRLSGLSQYYLTGRENCPPSTVVLGYASLGDEDIPALAAALKEAWLGQPSSS